MQSNFIYEHIEKLPLFFTLLVLLFSSQQNSYAQSSVGGMPEMYLLREVGTRPIAMSGAYSAIANDPITIFYNPAGFGFFNNTPTFQASVGALGLGRTNSIISYGQQLADNFGMGVGINSLFSGSFQGRDERGNPTRTMSANQFEFIASGAYHLDFASFGVSVKYLNDNLTGSDLLGNGFAFDLGTKFNVLDMFSFALSVRNLYGRMYWNNTGVDYEVLPYEIRSGIAMEWGFNASTVETRSPITGEIQQVSVPATKYVILSFEGSFIENSVSPSICVGVEVAPDDIIAFRGGLELYGEKLGQPQLFPFNKWGAGVSLRPNIANLFPSLNFISHIDYTISNEYLASSGISHHISLTFILQ
ncbi:MAG TPA: hypothetical protein P5545_05250 [Bacteroidota bacterium]|nr:hypothetical protein [Candidatus Kapabacteria bacterium]HRS01938.1 hypothetical protein [Bacteroidota bacterium]